MTADRYPLLREFAEGPTRLDVFGAQREAQRVLAELDRLRAQVASFTEEVDELVTAIGRRDAALLRVQRRLMARVHVGFAAKLDSGWWLRSGTERPEGAGWVHVYVDAHDLGGGEDADT